MCQQFCRRLWSSLVKVCTNVEVEPQLQPLDNVRLNLREAWCQVRTKTGHEGRGLWSGGVTAFFNVRVTHVNSKSLLNLHLQSTQRQPR